MAARITVLMSAFNSELTIQDAVDSILAQSYRDFELVVYDDASTDKTGTILESYDDPRLVFKANTENRGLTQNLIEGVSCSDAKYIARMDADDIAMPDRLERQVAFMESHSDVDVLGTNVIFFDDSGSEAIGIQPEHHEDIAIKLFYGFTMLHPTVMIRNSVIKENNLNYSMDFKYSQDFDLWSRMIADHKFANLQVPLLKLREHPNKISRAKRTEQQALTNRIRARQIKRVWPEATDESIRSIAAACRGDSPESEAEFALLEASLRGAADANEDSQIYQANKFRTGAANLLRAVCRRALMSGNAMGTIYYKSPLRHHISAVTRSATVNLLVFRALASFGVSVRS